MEVETTTVLSPQADTISPRTFYSWIFCLLTLLVLAGALGFMKISDLRAEIDSRPPVAILDVNANVMSVIDNTPGISADAATRKTYEIGAKLARSGYVVLDRSTLVAYPDAFEVRKESGK